MAVVKEKRLASSGKGSADGGYGCQRGGEVVCEWQWFGIGCVRLVQVESGVEGVTKAGVFPRSPRISSQSPNRTITCQGSDAKASILWENKNREIERNICLVVWGSEKLLFCCEPEKEKVFFPVAGDRTGQQISRRGTAEDWRQSLGLRPSRYSFALGETEI